MHIQQHTGSISPQMMALLLVADPDNNAVLSYLKLANIFIAEVSNEIVGIALLTLENNKAELKNISVLTKYQGKGIAKTLIHKVKENAKQQGASEISVGTGNSSLSQMALYQKCGFRFVNIIPNFFEHYPESIYENGIHCLDMIVLRAELKGI